MNELQLVVTKNITGVLETNIDKLENFISERLKDYEPSKYSADGEQAKKDRAELNNAKKQIAESRKALIKELMKPYSDFETRCKNLEKSIETASGKLDEIVKIKEAEEKASKKELIKELWDKKNFDLFPLDKIFNTSWVNKTKKLSEVEKEIDSIINKTYDELKIIENQCGEYSELVKAYYLDCLNVTASIAYCETMKANSIKVAEEKTTRENREHEKALEEQKKELVQEVLEHNKKESFSSLVSEALEIETPVAPVKEYVLSFNGTEAQMLGLKNYLTMQGIEITSLKELSF